MSNALKPFSIIELAKTSYRPIAVYNKNEVINRYKWWNLHLPKIKPYYAIKSFTDNHILDTLSKFDIGFDVASRQEIKRVLNYNKPIILSNPFKTELDIDYAYKKGINTIVCNTISEAFKIKKYNPNGQLIWRIQSAEQYSKIKFNNKFGANLEETKEILKHDLNIVGISFHVGSLCLNMDAYKNTLAIIEKDIIPLFNKHNKNIQLIDIGGGYNDLDDIINLKKCISKLDIFNKYSIISEPGRYFSKNSITLYTKIIAIRELNDIINIYINDSIYNTFSGKIFDHQTFKPVLVKDNLETTKLKRCNIWGNTCDSADLIVDNIYLPSNIIEGDILRWNNIGAYSIASSVNGFNGFKKAKIIDIDIN
jgi:ornithine decarboxylase